MAGGGGDDESWQEEEAVMSHGRGPGRVGDALPSVCTSVMHKCHSAVVPPPHTL